MQCRICGSNGAHRHYVAKEMMLGLRDENTVISSVRIATACKSSRFLPILLSIIPTTIIPTAMQLRRAIRSSKP